MERFFMERLKYIVEDSTIAELLGVQNFTNKESAILELVKNAYDAQASTVSITFSDHSIVIVDDGIGMSKSTIYENWMHVGKSDKGYSLFGVGENDGRVLAGSKGVGRFALARLGESVAVYSVKKGEVPVKWTTDWSESILDDFLNEENLPTGTRIEISALRDRLMGKKTMFSNNVNLNQIVAFVNSKTLKSDLTTEEISRLNTIRVKLIGRRK